MEKPGAQERPWRPHRWLLRGESIIASTGLTFAAILLAVMSGTTYWTLQVQRSALESARADEIRSLGIVLAETTGVMLRVGELSTVRRLLVETARDYDLEACRLTLPDGQVVAAADPGQITLLALPPTWSSDPVGAASAHSSDGVLIFSQPLSIPGRGTARLDLTANVHIPWGRVWEAQSGVGIIGALAMVALLLAYRRMRGRLRSLGVIREVLLAMGGSKASEQELALRGEAGPEVRAWNQLIAEKARLQKRLLSARVDEVVESRPRANRQLQEMCDAMRRGVILVDGTLRATYANGAAAVYLRSEPNKIIGQALSDTSLDQKVLKAVQDAISGLARSWKSVEVDNRDQETSGVLRFSVRPLRREDTSAAMIVIEDITQQRVADESRSAFVTQVAHELRAPLTNIRLSAETAIEDGEEHPQVRANLLNIINQEAKRLERVVSDMLSVAEMEAGTLDLRKDDVRLDALFEDLNADYGRQAQLKNITLEFNVPPKLPVIQADRDKLALVVHNLLNNAIKYTKAGGRVVVNVDIDHDTLMVDVIDNGMGIASDDIKRIFEKFYRATDAREAGITGSGLGLALARQIVNLHGGEIEVESKVNKGSTFSVRLPIATKAA